jgi:DNA mismatch repair protein MutL
MTPEINILPEHIANKIAAGEVVQRPASVLKELLENSLDAGANDISIVLKESGKTLVQVVDNGSGMGSEDARLAFSRHATSKISAFEDLERIRTFGFRGEALASIAAVSQVELRTRRSGSPVGTKIILHGGAQVEATEDAAATGTSIAVKQLFYNTPGRRNFLKSDTTEFHHCLGVVQRMALAYPEIAITFFSDGEKVLSLPAGESLPRIRELFGQRVADSVFYFEEINPFMTVRGYIGKPEYFRKTRFEQYTFLNRRTITNKSISYAVVKAYEHLLEKGTHPFFILFIEIDPGRVDVNVHPAKMEVKFEDESAAYRHVFHAVRRALGEHDLLPMMGMKEERADSGPAAFTSPGPAAWSSQRVVDWRELLRTDPRREPPSVTPDSSPHATTPAAVPADQDFSSQPPSEGNLAHGSGVTLLQLHNKYILLQTSAGILLIDQHAAHERVIYEQTVERFGRQAATTQQLLFPIVNEMSPSDVEIVKLLQPLLEDLGFQVKIFGKTTIILDGIPPEIKPGTEQSVLEDLLDLYKEDEHSIELPPKERLAKSYSCRAAVKAGDPLNQAEMQGLLDQLFATKLPFVCPHGRPVSIKIPLAELDKRFGRTT